MSIWTWNINIANAQQALQKLGGHYDDLYDKMVGKMGDNIAKWNIWEKMVDYMINLTQKLVAESRELLAISTKYDIPISRMGELQMMAQMSGQSIGQVARNLRFLEMNISRALLKPGGPQYAAFRELGISQQELNAGAKDTAGFFDVVRAKVMTIGDEERRNNFLQAIFGANWQNMLPLLEANKTQISDMASSAYKYNDAMVRALATVEQGHARNEQALKPVANMAAVLLAALNAGLTASITGVIAVVTIIVDKLYQSGKFWIGVLQVALGIMAKIGNIAQRVNPVVWAISKISGTDVVEMTDAFGDASIDAGKSNVKEGAAGAFKNPLDVLSKEQLDRMEAAKDSMAMAGFAMEAMVGGNDGDIKKVVNKEIEKLKNAVAAGKQAELQYAAAIRENLATKAEGWATRVDILSAEANKRAEKTQEAINDLARVQRFAERNGLSQTPATGKSTARTDVELANTKAREKNISDIDAAWVMAKTRMAAEIETINAIKKQELEISKIKRERQVLQDTTGETEAEAIANVAKLEKAEIELFQKKKEHQYFLHKKDVQHIEAQRDRREDLIDSLEKRQQTFMSRQGMTGMDKQGVAVSQAIDQMKRDQEDMSRILADDSKDTAAKEAARGKVDKSALKAQDELDKLSLMQFQYGASDAAKKGMGGGIDIRENTLTVAKSQLDILKRQLDLMMAEAGLSRADYGGAPMIMAGAMRNK